MNRLWQLFQAWRLRRYLRKREQMASGSLVAILTAKKLLEYKRLLQLVLLREQRMERDGNVRAATAQLDLIEWLLDGAPEESRPWPAPTK